MFEGTKFNYDEEFVAVSSDLGRAVGELRKVRNELNETYRLLGAKRMQMRMKGTDTTELDDKISGVLGAIREIGDKIDSTLSVHLTHLQSCQVGYIDR